MPKILVSNKVSQVGIDLMEKAGFELVYAPNQKTETICEMVRDCDAIIARMCTVKKEVLSAGENLKIVCQHAVGLDAIDIEMATQLGICVTHTPIANGRSVAEFVMLLILAASRKLIPADYSLRVAEHFSERNCFVGNDVEGKTLGIIGMGRIGRQIAKMAGAGFDMKVVGFDPYVPAENMQKIGVQKADSIDEVLKISDFVSLNCPFTPEVDGLMSYEKFKSMKKTAFFINCARGQLSVDGDLKRALEDGVIAGAAVDVFNVEPTPSGYELMKAPNLIATAHIASLARESTDRMALDVANDLVRFFVKGEKPVYFANPEVWDKRKG